MKTKFLPLAAAVLMAISARDASAYLNIYALANPWIAGGYDPLSTTSGQVEYSVFHEANSTEGLSFFWLKFDASVFSSFALTGAKINGTSLTASQLSSYFDVLDLGDSFEFTTFSFPGLPVGSVMSLTFDYSLLAPAMNLDWPEDDVGGQMWAQSFGGHGTHWSYFSTIGHEDGGSTGLAPEPGTLMLLGTGLASLGAVKRYRQRRKSAV